ncbi:SusD/RagB family nutrient-binding outer membrane lipoprotein [Croceitalea marina]|uniref:SusD/RagB family nutrient-binding outer membrane lipoprotein n=1 Tax=Croceitalea marina TaxID=1775166 RepID=A0ABW5N2I3_9FLAO
MKNKNIFKHLFTSILLVAGLNSCETIELDQTENPLAVTEDQLDPDQLFNSIQIGFGQFTNTVSGDASFTQQVTRSFAMTGGNQYANAFSPGSFDGIWFGAYSGLLADIQALEPIAEEQGLTYQLGVAKIMKAYTLFTLVDLFGDVPFSEALLGNENLNPNTDPQTDVYTAALAELDSAISILGTETTVLPSDDLYYAINNGGSVSADLQAKWITAAKTLKLRVYNNIRLNGSAIGVDVVSGINALLAENDLIDTPEEDWQGNYNSTRVNPDSRHPGYARYYENGAGGYMSNYLMWAMTFEKGLDDPRLRYYFFRQDDNATNEDIFTLGCAVQSAPGHYGSVTSIYNTAATPFCTADATRGYWGRDHGDNGGIPPDGQKRTVFGVYPVGGAFDIDDADDVQNEGEDGLLGAGIEPVLLSSYVNFIKAEAALTLGTTGDPRALLETAIRQSIAKVTSFGGLDPERVITADDPDTAADETVLQGDFFPTQTAIDNYVTTVLDLYDASDNTTRLDIIMKEYHIAAFGNGLETYNGYRRTGFPSNFQPTLEVNSGDFYRSALYPASYVNRNNNATQKERTEQVFWDTNAAGFIN